MTGNTFNIVKDKWEANVKGDWNRVRILNATFLHLGTKRTVITIFGKRRGQHKRKKKRYLP